MPLFYDKSEEARDLEDSGPATRAHIALVAEYIGAVREELAVRARDHDASKLEAPEKEYFDRFTPMLRGLTYGSPQYRETLDAMRPAIDHHQKSNRHHPEFHAAGISGMNLVDLLEMICDWLAATKRHDDGDIRKSIEINAKRFGYSDELRAILGNTVDFLEGKKP